MDLHYTQIYCHNSDCNVRRSTVFTKDFGDQPDPENWRCPGCGHPATVNWRRTSAEQARIESKDAVFRVKEAIHRRDRGQPLCFRLSDLPELEKLPDSWK